MNRQWVCICLYRIKLWVCICLYQATALLMAKREARLSLVLTSPVWSPYSTLCINSHETGDRSFGLEIGCLVILTVTLNCNFSGSQLRGLGNWDFQGWHDIWFSWSIKERNYTFIFLMIFSAICPKESCSKFGTLFFNGVINLERDLRISERKLWFRKGKWFAPSHLASQRDPRDLGSEFRFLNTGLISDQSTFSQKVWVPRASAQYWDNEA